MEQVIVGIVLFIGLSLFWQTQVSLCQKFLKRKIKDVMTEMKGKPRENFSETAEDKLHAEVDLFLLEAERNKLTFLTEIVGYIEMFFFATVTFLLYASVLSPGNLLIEKLKLFIISISGWLLIKVVGGYQQWSGPVFGRATFYMFMAGTLLNIVGGVILGFLAFLFFLNV